MSKQQYLYIISFSFLLSFSIGCKTKKNIPTSPIDKSSLTEADFKQKRAEHNVDFEWYGSKATIKFESEEFILSAKLYTRMEHGKYIWMVGKKLGIEGVRILITPDSFTALMRQNRTYILKSFEDVKLEYGINLSFTELQDLLAGNILSEEENVEELSGEFNAEHFVTNLAIRDFLVKYWQSIDDGIIENSKVSDAQDRIILSEFGDYKYSGQEFTSYFRKYTIPKSEFGNLLLELDHSSIEFDIPQDMPFEIPSHYEKLD